jgi:uncharacterized membrane protein YedE/YeeE
MQGRGHPAVDASCQGYSEGMQGVLAHRPAWYVLGPLIGLVVLGLLVAINERFGVLGGYSNVVERVTRRSPVLGWKGWLLVGVLGGSLVFTLLAGPGAIPDGYGWLTRTFSGSAGGVAVGGLLLVAGALIGFGAKTAGGCTSGNGLGGCSAASASSFAATATFMSVAIVVSFLIKAVT